MPLTRYAVGSLKGLLKIGVIKESLIIPKSNNLRFILEEQYKSKIFAVLFIFKSDKFHIFIQSPP